MIRLDKSLQFLCDKILERRGGSALTVQKALLNLNAADEYEKGILQEQVCHISIMC